MCSMYIFMYDTRDPHDFLSSLPTIAIIICNQIMYRITGAM